MVAIPCARQSECTFEEAMQYTNGRAVFASGSPFPAMEWQGQTFIPGQANNAYSRYQSHLLRVGTRIAYQLPPRCPDLLVPPFLVRALLIWKSSRASAWAC